MIAFCFPVNNGSLVLNFLRLVPDGQPKLLLPLERFGFLYPLRLAQV